MSSKVPRQGDSFALANDNKIFAISSSGQSLFSVTVGPSQPRIACSDRQKAIASSAVFHELARIASRHGPTTVIDGQGGAMVLGAPDGDIELF